MLPRCMRPAGHRRYINRSQAVCQGVNFNFFGGRLFFGLWASAGRKVLQEMKQTGLMGRHNGCKMKKTTLEAIPMKRLLTFLLALVLCMGVANAARGEGAAVPEEIQKLLAPAAEQGFRVADCNTALKNIGWIFAALQNDAGHNLLVIYQNVNGAWKEYLKSDKPIPQGKKLLSLYADTNGFDHGFLNLSVNTPVFGVWQANSDREDETEYNERYVNFTLTDGKWLLFYWEDFSGDLGLWVTDDSLKYVGSFPGEYQYKGTVRGSIQRDVRYLNLSSIPRSYKEARQKLTEASDIPEGELKAQKIRFVGGQKYPVYSGPGENYVRASSGRAAVSTNDWIQVFGRQDGWILIQYAIDKDRMRFGWIDEKALPEKAQVEEFRFSSVRAYTAQEIELTDDPLFSQSMIAVIPECNCVTWLSSLGDEWAYVEWLDAEANRQPVRGFLPIHQLVHLSQEEAVRLAKEYILISGAAAEGERITEPILNSCEITAGYDSASHLWTVIFISERDGRREVRVDDREGAIVSPADGNG